MYQPEPIVKKYRNEFAKPKDIQCQWTNEGQGKQILEKHLQKYPPTHKTYTLISIKVKNPLAYPYQQNYLFKTKGSTIQTNFSLPLLIKKNFCDPRILRFIFFKKWYYFCPYHHHHPDKDQPLLAVIRTKDYENHQEFNVWSIYTVEGGNPPTKFEKICDVYTTKFVYLTNKR